ncbi:MAG: ATP-binding protein, partial [Actinotalea sp.]|nr:ATP-binding protein [Actinotalea sp.]
DRPLEQEWGVGDLDPAQVRVLDALAAGHHLLLDAPPGSDVAGTLAAVVADAAATGRTVLYVAGHRRAGHALVERLAALGLDELVLDVAPDSGWRQQAASRLLAAMTVQPVAVPQEQVAVVQRELLDRRRRLAGYIEGLHRPRRPWDASAYDALQALARLTSTRPGPQTTVRLSTAVAESLTPERRAQAAADLVRVAALGAFSAATRSSAWYGADLLTPDRAREALRRVETLLDTVVPRVTAEAERVAEATGLVVAQTPAQWSEQLTMLAEVRSALDVFQPLVFERTAADLVAATATSAWRAERGIEMSGMVRRRLRKQAKDLLRPGRPVEDLHAALVHVQEQREVWQAHCPAGGWPRVPAGLAEIEEENAELVTHLEALDATLGLTGDDRLTHLSWAGLTGRLQRLRNDQVALEVLPERTALLRNLARQGLGALVEDLEDRQVGPGSVAAELDLAWWTSVFEEILRQDPALAGYDGTALARLVAEFRTLDRRHLRDRALLGLAGARELLRTRLRGADEEAQGLFAELVEHRFSGLRTAVERYPRVVRHLRPCLVASPMLVPQLLPAHRGEDLVVLDAAGHLPLEVVVPALARGRQVLVVGDTRSASGTALPALAEVLPTLALHADASRRDPYLTAFLGEHGYAGMLTATPLPATQALLRLDVVDGVGMPNAQGAVESTQAEVDHVLELVTEHALTRPEESLAVVTASPVHATRVRDAVMAEVRQNPSLEHFFRADRSEPFVVAEAGATQGLSRDAVVLSLGFGRTPHGRVLHRFGALSEPGGDGRLLEALGATRHRLTVVACFGADDLDPERLRAPGAVALRDLLVLAAERTAAAAEHRRVAPDGGPEPDRLVLDLAERLWRMGLAVELHHGVPGGAHLPLVVGHPDVPDEWLVAVLTDDDTYVGEPSVRVRDRQVAERLERLGWTVAQVWSAAVFLDPSGEAEAIAQAAAEAARRRAAVRAARPVVRVPARVLDDDALDDGAPADGADAPSADADDADTPSADADGAADESGAGDDAGAAVATDAPHGDRAAGPSRVDTGVAVVSAVPTPRGPRPDVERGLPANAYTDDQLDDLVVWIRADGRSRDDAELATALREELGVTRRGARIDAVVEAAVRRAR